MHQWLLQSLSVVTLVATLGVVGGPIVAAVEPSVKVEKPLPGIVFVSGDIYSLDPDTDGKHTTRYWREGYIYHRATTLDPMERTMTPTRPGRNLYTLVPAEPSGRLTRITHLTEGAVFDPEVSYDGKKVLFSMRRDGEDWFHLCEINADGSKAVQLTDGPFNDVSGVYLPDGRIVFVSDRAGYLEEYHEERTETLWVMNGDGTGIRQLTFNPGTVYDPTVLADGRICYSFWDVFMLNVPPIDKHETYVMTIRPDGTEESHLFGVRQQEFFDRERHSGSSLTQTGQLPDGTLLVLSEMGPSIIDLSRGPCVSEALWPVFPGTTSLQLGGASHRVHLSPTGSCTTPYPLPDGRFLCAVTLPGARDLGVYACNPQTRQMQLIFNDPEKSEYDARPILLERPRPRILPSKFTSHGAGFSSSEGSQTNETRAASKPDQSAGLVPITGRARFVVVNPRRSDNTNQQRALSRARYYRVIESLQTAVTSSSHTSLATRILGVVPIPPDGPVDFEAPADTPLFLEALDAAGNRVLFDWDYPVTSVPVGSKQPLVEMSTFTARPGEIKSCHGCHAPQPETVPTSLPALDGCEPVQIGRDLTDILYRRNEPDEYRTAARIGEAPRYRRWLTAPDADLRRRACEMLMAIEDGARQDAPAIARLLEPSSPTASGSAKSEPASVRRAAALALTRLGTLDQTPLLLDALADPDREVRHHAANALEAITGCIPTEPEDVAAPFAYYERLLVGARGVEGLRALLGRGPDALLAFHVPADADIERHWFEAAGRLGATAPNSARQIVRQALDIPPSPPSQFQARAGKQHHVLTGAVPPVAAIRAAGWLKDKASVPLIIPWLTRHDYNYHAVEAALALGRIGTTEAIEALWKALGSELPKRRPYLNRYVQHGPRPEEYTLLRGLILADAVPSLENIPLVIGLLPGSFLEKPRYEDRLRPESQRVLLGRLLLEQAGLRTDAIRLLVDVLREGSKKSPQSSQHKNDPLYQQVLKGINLERPYSEHGRTFPVVEQIEPEQALWLLGCLVKEDEDASILPKPEEMLGLFAPYLTSLNWRERIDATVLLNRLGTTPQIADLLATEIAKPYGFREILSIGKGRPEPNYRDKCYMLMALAHHTDRVQQLEPFADPKRWYRDIRYGLALGLGYRGKPDGIGLLLRLATREPVSVIRRQALESLRAIQETQRLAGQPVPRVDWPEPAAPETVHPPRPLDWPGPVTQKERRPSTQPRTLEELKQAVAGGFSSERYRNLNNTNNQAPGATRMMIHGSDALVKALEELARRFPEAAEPLLRKLLDSPYPFAHYLALQQLAEGGYPGLEGLLVTKLDVYAKSADAAGFYWICEVLASRGARAAVAPLAKYAQPKVWPGLHGPIGMGYGYPAAKALARLASDTSHPEVARLLKETNIWLRAGAIAGLSRAKTPGVLPLLQRLQGQHPPALVRAEAALARNRLRATSTLAAKP